MPRGRMPLRKTLLLLAAVLVLGPSAAMAQAIDNDIQRAAGASGSEAGLISGGGKVYSNLEAIENSARPKDAIPETRKVSKKQASADDRENHPTRTKKKQKTANKEIRYREVRYDREVRYLRGSGFNAFIAPGYLRY